MIRQVNTAVHNRKGFTMVELMIVVIIVGILTAVGVPLYIGYVRDSKAASAEMTISTIVRAEKLYRQKHGVFINVADTDFEGLPENNPLGIDIRDATQNWTLAVTDVAGAGETFTVTATGKTGTEYEGIVVELAYDLGNDESWTRTDNGVAF
jgi:prepilin-type N-terminal cleavage/methylation domain-containing protein